MVTDFCLYIGFLGVSLCFLCFSFDYLVVGFFLIFVFILFNFIYSSILDTFVFWWKRERKGDRWGSGKSWRRENRNHNSVHRKQSIFKQKQNKKGKRKKNWDQPTLNVVLLNLFSWFSIFQHLLSLFYLFKYLHQPVQFSN